MPLNATPRFTSPVNAAHSTAAASSAQAAPASPGSSNSPGLTAPSSDFRPGASALAGSAQASELRRRQHIARHSFGKPGADLERDPGIASMLKNREHRAIQVHEQNFTEVRRALQQVLLERGEPCVFLNDDSMQDRLTGKGIVRDRKPTSVAGEYDSLLESGGTLIFNHSAYAPEGLEAFNEVMQRQELGGKKLPNNVRILLLDNVDDTSRPLTLAQLTRTMPLDMTGFRASALADVPVSPPERHPQGVQLIDLQYDPEWRDVLWSTPENASKGWQMRPGWLSQLDKSKPVVLRCPMPGDPYLQDQIKVLQAQGFHIRVENQPSSDEISERVANKLPAASIEALMVEGYRGILCVNPATLNQVIADIDYIGQDDLPARQPSLLSQAARNNAEPLVFISDDLTDTEWMRLMLHPAAFKVAAAAHVKPMPPFASRVHVLPAKPLPAAPADQALSRPVNLIHSSDAGLAARFIGRSEAATIVHFTKETKADELFLSFDVKYDDPEHFIKLKAKPLQFLKDLQEGKLVCLYGLEANPDVAQLLAPLLNPPHYLFINGKRLSFANGSLKGRLAIFSDDQKFLQKYRQSPQFADRFADRAEWERACLYHLLPENKPPVYRHLGQAQLTDLLSRLQQLTALVKDSGVMAGQAANFNFERFDMLCRHLFNQPQQRGFAMRSLYQDMLIGEVVQVDSAKGMDDHERVRMGLRLLFPEQMEYLPPQHVDGQVLAQLLAGCHHLKDLENNVWKLLNCLDLDTVRQLFAEVCPNDAAPGDPANVAPLLIEMRKPGNMAELTNKVLRVVFDLSIQHTLQLPPLVLRARSGMNIRTQVGPLGLHAGLPVAANTEMNRRKAGLLANAGNMVFAEGPPGAGKSHAMAGSSSGKVIKANACDIGNGSAGIAFNDAMREWMTTPGAELWLDEANLAGPRALNFFRSLLDNGTMVIDGVRYTLPKGNKLKAAGNSTMLHGRTRQNFIDAIPTQRYEGFHEDELRSLFLEPMLRKAFNPGAGPMPKGLAQLMETLLSTHVAFARTFPDQAYSQRNLEEFTGQLAVFLKHYPGKASPAGYGPYVMRFALETYGSALSEAGLATCRTWLAQRLQIRPDAPAPLAVHVDLSTSSLAPTEATQTLCDRLAWRLRAAQSYRSFTDRPSIPGQSLIIIQGPPAAGKDDAVRATLDSLKMPFLSGVADLKRIDEIQAQVKQAYDRDIPYLLSESNMIPSRELEARFNNFLTGQEGPPGQAAKRNFCIIGTENALSLDGRSQRSGALNNRAYTIHARSSSPDDTSAIVMRKAQDIQAGIDHAASHTPNSPVESAQSLRGKLFSQVRAGTLPGNTQDQALLENFTAFHQRLLEILGTDKRGLLPGPRQITMFLRQVMVGKLDWKEALDDVYGNFIKDARAALKAWNRKNPSDAESIDLDDFLVPGWNLHGLADLDAILGHGVERFVPASTAVPTDAEPTRKQADAMMGAMRQIWRLSHPQASGEPDFEVIGNYPPDNDSGPDVRYNTEEHCVKAYIGNVGECDDMLRLFSSRIQRGLPFFDPQTGQMAGNTESAASFQDTLARSLQNTAASVPRFDPFGPLEPGGHGEIRGKLGTVSGSDRSVMLCYSYRSAAGVPLRLLPGQQGRFPNQPWNPQLHGPAITVEYDTMTVNPNGLCYLPGSLKKRPVEVRMGGVPVRMVGVDEFGGWYFPAPAGSKQIDRCSYLLVDAAAQRFEQPLAANFNLALHPELQHDVMLLAQRRLDVHSTVDELRELFRKHLRYDKDFERARDEELANVLLRGQQGVCQHFAVASAAILTGVFGIQAHTASGHRTEGSVIPFTGHQLTHCIDENGDSFEVDFTVPLAPRRGSRTDQMADANSFEKGFQLYYQRENLENLVYPQNFDAATLGLVKRKVNTGMANYNNAGLGQLSAAMQARRAPRPFVKSASGSTIEYKAVHFTDFPKNLPDDMTITGLAILLTPALDALKIWNNGAIQVNFPRITMNTESRNQHGPDFVPLSSALELFCMVPASATALSSIASREDVVKIGDDEASLTFLHKLISHYLETLLEGDGVSPDNRRETFKIIKSTLDDCMEITPHLPIHFYLHGEKWTMTRQDSELADIDLQTENYQTPEQKIGALLRHVGLNYVESGDFAEDSPIVIWLQEHLQELEDEHLLVGSLKDTISQHFRNASQRTLVNDIIDNVSLFERLAPWMDKLEVAYLAEAMAHAVDDDDESDDDMDSEE